MAFHHQILAGAFYPIRSINAVGQALGLMSPNQLRVLLYHDIAPSDQPKFKAQLQWLMKTWSFVSLQKFEAMVTGYEPICGRNLLLTFDDGFSSNRVVAEEVLNPLGIKALFFVVSELVDAKDKTEARKLIAANVCPGNNPHALPVHWSNMNWGDLEALLEQGHGVGGHTGTHKRLADVSSMVELEREIVASAQKLEQRLGLTIDHFAYTFGDLASFSEDALILAKRQFRFVYSGLRGDNARGASPFSLFRDSAASQDSALNYKVFGNRLLGSILEGAADGRYARDRSTLDMWNRRDC
jgi:peptidoglycan/xylan/chitin deacetylase (PgdA/CDA1 family)